MRIGILLTLPFMVLACKGEGINPANILAVTTTSTTSTTTTTIHKDLFSQWDENGPPGKRLPFTGKVYNFTTGDTIFLIDNGTQCICQMLITPNPGGSITFSSCSGTGCAGIQNTYTWTNSSGTLTMCELSAPTVCTSYH